MDRKRRRKEEAGGRRLHINCLNVVITCVILFAANSLAGGHFPDRINRININLSRSLDAALELQVTNYTSIYENVTYSSSVSNNPRGMTGLYNITIRFIDLLAPKDVYPEGVLKVENGKLKLGSLEEQWQSILSHYGALLAIIILLLLFAILMPICGFCFCCCRCCGKCGARSKPFDKKGDLCKKICLASLLICVGTLLLFGVVCSFVTNQTLQDHMYELPPTLKNNLKDTDSYLMYTGRQLDVLSRINYKEFEKALFNTLDKCSDIVLEQLEEYSNASSLTEIINIVNTLNDTQSHLHFISKSTSALQVNASQLNDGLRKLRGDLLTTLRDCDNIQGCEELYNDYIRKLGTEIDYDELPNISDELKTLTKVLDDDINGLILSGGKALNDIKKEINGTVSRELPLIKDTITKIGMDLTKYGVNISSAITRTRNAIHEYVDSPVADIDKYIKEYSPYRYYLGIAISCILLLVSLCIALGLICGICGKRPDAYGDDCCNKGAGSRFLMLGVAIMFLFSIVLAVVAIAHLFTGILAQRLICDSLRNPKDSKVIDLVDQIVNAKENIGLDANISSFLVSIHSNRSIYNTFNLKNKFDLEEVNAYIDKFNIDELMNELKDKIKVDSLAIKLISDDTERQLNELIRSGIDEIKFDHYTEELTRSLTTVNLLFLADKLDELVEAVNKQFPRRKDLATSLMLSALHLRSYQNILVVPMTDTSRQVIESIKIVQKNFNSNTIQHLLDEVKSAEEYLKVNGTYAMLQIANSFATGLERQVYDYIDRIVSHIKNDLGATEPIGRAFNSVLVATCDKLILPWNGFWFSIFWCLIFFIPAILLSVKLAGLYQKYEAYPGPLVEASRNDKRYRKKKKHKRLDNRGSYVAEPPSESSVAREVPSGSARYSDMAPKHWEEFPAGGPPHYQRAPTEYERPPPYYYPGTGEQQ